MYFKEQIAHKFGSPRNPNLKPNQSKRFWDSVRAVAWMAKFVLVFNTVIDTS